MKKYRKMKACTIRMDYHTWANVQAVAGRVPGDEYAKSASRLVRRCVDYCKSQGILVKLANAEE